jgi:ATP-dependent DNA helicase RecG
MTSRSWKAKAAYEVLLCTGRPAPEVAEGDDRVTVTVRKRIMNPTIVDFVAKADQTFMLTQRERITLGLLAQHEALTAIQLGRALELGRSQDIGDWLGRLVQWEIVKTRGRTKGTEYFVGPDLLRKLDFRGTTSLRNIEGHRLRQLILQDLDIYREAKISEIHKRIGTEIPQQKLRRALKGLVEEGVLKASGEKRGRQYLLAEKS